MKNLILFLVFIIASYLPLVSQPKLGTTHERNFYDYVHLSIAVSPALAGNQARMISGRTNDKSNFFGVQFLRDKSGKELRFVSVADLIEYMEHIEDFELVKLLVAGESNETFHIILRRQINLDENEWEIRENEH